MEKLLILFVLAACSTEPIKDPPPNDNTAEGEILAKGWSTDYTKYIKANLTPRVLGFEAPSFCPKFSALSADDRKDFWAALLEATAYPESGFDRFNRFIETGISGKDPVTGKTVESDGLLQVSYGDFWCKGVFDYPGDKDKPVKEWSIFNPYKNLFCGIMIWDGLINKYGPDPTLRSIGGKYWSTIRDHKVDPYFKKRFPKCF